MVLTPLVIKAVGTGLNLGFHLVTNPDFWLGYGAYRAVKNTKETVESEINRRLLTMGPDRELLTGGKAVYVPWHQAAIGTIPLPPFQNYLHLKVQRFFEGR